MYHETPIMRNAVSRQHIIIRKERIFGRQNAMGRKLVTAVKELTDQQKRQIAEEAERLGFTAEIFDIDNSALRPEEIVFDAAKDAEVIFSTFAALGGAAADLKWFCTPYAGVEEFTAPDVFLSEDAVLTNSSGAYGVTISEHVVMVTLEILRREPEYRNYVSQKKWVRKLPIRSIHGSRILLLGTGNIGCEIARRFRNFEPACITGMNTRGANPDGLFDRVFPIDQLDEHLKEADIVAMSLPGTGRTRHILNKERLSALADGTVIVNVGRGKCIDEKALEAELRSGRLYAALDVFETEPIPEDSTLWDCPNLRITPHVSGDLTLPYTRNRVVEMFLENLSHYVKGEPMERLVDPGKGY